MTGNAKNHSRAPGHDCVIDTQPSLTMNPTVNHRLIEVLFSFINK